jgi:hypothetical protein
MESEPAQRRKLLMSIWASPWERRHPGGSLAASLVQIGFAGRMPAFPGFFWIRVKGSVLDNGYFVPDLRFRYSRWFR